MTSRFSILLAIYTHKSRTPKYINKFQFIRHKFFNFEIFKKRKFPLAKKKQQIKPNKPIKVKKHFSSFKNFSFSMVLCVYYIYFNFPPDIICTILCIQYTQRFFPEKIFIIHFHANTKLNVNKFNQ